MANGLRNEAAMATSGLIVPAWGYRQGVTIQRRTTQIDVPVPPGTTSDAPYTQQISLGDVWLYTVEVRIPPGPSGLAGIQVVSNGTTVVPWTDDVGWLIGENHDRFPTTTKWTRRLPCRRTTQASTSTLSTCGSAIRP